MSAKTGKRIAGAPVSWVTPDGVGGTVEHLAARGLNNELLVFFWTPAHDWQVVDVTAKTGRAVVGDVDAVAVHATVRWSSSISGGVSPDGTLSVFWWSPAHDWQAINVSSIAGGTAAGRTVSWVAGGVEHVAVARQQQRTVRLLVDACDELAPGRRHRDHRHVDRGGQRRRISSRRPARTRASRRLAASTTPCFAFGGGPIRDWQAQNLTLATGAAVSSGPTAWQTPSAQRSIEHAAAVDRRKSLVVV